MSEKKDLTEEARERFANDIFATQTTGIHIEKAEELYAKCTLNIEPKHLNANKTVMGGAIFTLADFTVAVAVNNSGTSTVSLNNFIQFLGVAKGKQLIAETECIKAGRSTVVVNVNIHDDLGNLVARMQATGFRLS